MTTPHYLFRPLALLLGVAGLLAPRPVSAVPFVITYTDAANEGFKATTPYNFAPYQGQGLTLGQVRRRAIEAAAANWANRLQGTVPVMVNASMDPLGGTANGAVLGGASPQLSVANYSNAPRTNTFYPIALANQFAGADLVPPGNAQGTPSNDIVIQYNSDVDNNVVLGTASFYYGTDGRLRSSGGTYYDIDFYATCLHEIGHGLGFTSGLTSSGAIATYPRIFAVFLANGPDANATRLTAMTEAQRKTAITSGALYWAGPNGRMALNNVANPKIYAPNPYETGSSVSHLDETEYGGAFPNAGLNELMTPLLGPGVNHFPGPITSGIFLDMGWSFNPYTMADAARALRAYGGLLATQETDIARLNREAIARNPGALDLLDVVRLTRAAAGRDPNPYVLGTP